MIKSLLYSAIAWSIGQCVLSLICYYAYKLVLFDLIKVDITFVQWVAIVLISACLMPGKLFTTNNDNKNNKEPISKLNEFVFSVINKNK